MSVEKRRLKARLRRAWVDILFCRHQGHPSERFGDMCLRCGEVLD